MSEVDIAILAVIAVSAVISFMRGFFREAMSLGTWVAAIVITLLFTSRFAVLLPMDAVQSPQARATISAAILFIGTLLVGNLINWIFGRIMARSVVGKADRAIGVGFGVLRGGIIVVLLVLAAHLVPALKQESWWRNSTLIPRFEKVAAVIHSRLPDSLRQHFEFSASGY